MSIGGHRPDSHPVVARAALTLQDVQDATMHDIRGNAAADRVLDDVSADRRSAITASLDLIALTVAAIPDVPLSVNQVTLAKVLAAELMRRASR